MSCGSMHKVLLPVNWMIQTRAALIKLIKEKAAKTIIKTDAALPDKPVILRYTEVHNV